MRIISRGYLRQPKEGQTVTQGFFSGLHGLPNGNPRTELCGFHGLPNGYTSIDIYQGSGGEVGYRTRRGLRLTACCAFCRVWITDEHLEFDGVRHRCNPVDNRRYRQPWLTRRRRHQEQLHREHAERIRAKRAALKGIVA